MGERPRAGHHLLDPVLLAMATLAAATLPWFLAGPGGPSSSWVIQTGLDLTIVVLAARLIGEPTARPAARRFYRALVAGGALCAAGDLYQTVWVVLHPGETGIRLTQSVLVTAGMSVIVVTMLVHPVGRGSRRLRLWLDAATALVAVAAFLWYFSVAVHFTGGAADRYVAAAGAAVMLVIAFAVAKLILSGTAPFTLAAGAAGSLGVAGTAVGTSVGLMLAERSDPGIAYVAQLLPCILAAASIRLQQLQMRRRANQSEALARRFSRMPYVAVAAVELLLLVALHDAGLDARAWGVVAGVLVSTLLVLTRQLIAFHDNDRLLTSLDRSMLDLRTQEEWFRSLVQHGSDVTLVAGADQVVRYAGPAVERVLGIAPDRLVGTRLAGRLHAADEPASAALLERLAAHPGVSASAQLRVRHADGSYRWLDVVGTDLRDNASVRGIVLNARDVTEARRLQEELRHQATHDTLTGLANRTLLQERLDGLAGDAPVSLAVLDLDGFKQVNDVHGHHAGDALLAEVARRLRAELEPGDLPVRLGGDEFALLLPGGDRWRAARIVERCTAALHEPVRVAGVRLSVGVSAGVATGPARDAARLLVQADAAMYLRKHGPAGRGTPAEAVLLGPGRTATDPE
jgi:diguanylate cyclase (GGDEF)-like protein/PAS domain S-box-containing protein